MKLGNLTTTNGNSLNVNSLAEDLRPKINDAISILQDKTCLTFSEVGLSYGGDHIKMHKGNGLENSLILLHDHVFPALLNLLFQFYRILSFIHREQRSKNVLFRIKIRCQICDP